MGNTLTVVRAQENTSAASFAAGSRFELRVTVSSVEDKAEEVAEQIAIEKVQEFKDDLAADDGSSLVGFEQSSNNAVSRTSEEKLRETVSVKDFGADDTGVQDSTAAFANALAAADNVFVPEGKYRIDGTITLPLGATLYGETNTGRYFPGQSRRVGTQLFKDSSSSDGPLVVVTWTSGLRNLQLIHEKSGGATEGIIKFDDTAIVTYASIDNVHVYGLRTTDVSGSTTCYGIKLVGSPTTSRVMFFNRVSGCTVTDCDVAIFLGPLANANVFTNIITRECHVHYELKGSSSYDALENVFTSLGLFSISGALSPSPICFKLTEYAKNNIFSSYATETYGVEFSPTQGTGNSGNIFLGTSNESVSWTNQTNLRFMQPTNISNGTTHPLVTRSGNDRYVTGGASKWHRQFRVAGTMPSANNNAGTFALNASSKVLFRFDSNLSVQAGRSFRCQLRVFAYGPFGTGAHIADVEFIYRTTTSVTPGSYAGQLCVTKVVNKGSQITGLYFLSGTAAGEPMGVGITCGNYGAFAMDRIRCFVDVETIEFAGFETFFFNMEGLSSTTTAAPTADDVTDSISLLSIADTSVT